MHNFRRIFLYLPATLADLSCAMLLLGSVLYGTNLGASTIEVGWIGAAYGLSYLLMPAIIGRVGDKLPRKTSLVIAALAQISVALFYLFVVATTFDLIVGQFLLGIANGFHWPALEAYISEQTGISHSSHSKRIANFCIAWSIGYSLGPFIAGVFSDYNVRDAFLLVFFLTIINFSIVVAGFSSERSIKSPNKTVPSLEQIVPVDSSLEKRHKTPDREFYALLIGIIVYVSAAKIVLSYFTNYAKLPEGLGWNGTLVGVVLLCFGIGRTVYFIIGRFLENSLRLIRIAVIIEGSLLVTLIFLKDLWSVGLIMGIFGLFGGLIYFQTLEMLLRHEQRAKGAKAGLFESMIGLGGSLSPLLAGFLAEIDLLLPFGVFAGFTFIFFLLQYFFTKNVLSGN